MDFSTVISLVIVLVLALGFVHMVYRAGHRRWSEAISEPSSVIPPRSLVYRFCRECRGYTNQAVLTDRWICFSCEDPMKTERETTR